ncbi:NERD domain-containing protein [Streptomyces armeniacus]|uniref:NERD domain-containing protein n=1 Tax=Streptomyces armeniacus TaxID=83291 RepID=A0A345Y1A8_9ACTN|nr:NERD domain-containing protein [Streptomyces armeniacus]
MSGLRVSRWKRYGHDRLYVSTAEGAAVAWLDCRNGEVTVLAESHREGALEALRPYLAARRPEPPPTESGPAAERPTGEPPAPSASAEPPAPAAPRSPDARAAPGRSPAPDGVRLPSAPERARGSATAAPPLSPDDDLARNRPGESSQRKLDELGVHPAAHLFRRLLRLLRLRSDAESWHRGLQGERAVAAELRRRCPDGWRVLHSIPLPGDVALDHLLIGPGGVFCVSTESHPKAQIQVGDDVVKIGGQDYPYVRESRGEAAGAARVLSRACGFTVEVTPLLVFVGAASVTVEPALLDVRAVERRQLAALVAASGVLAPQRVEEVYAAARDRRTWADA